MTVYPDTSFLISLYLPDRYSDEARRALAGSLSVYLTALHRAEWAHAVALHVARRQITEQQALRVTTAFELHQRQGLWHSIAIPEAAYESWAALAQRPLPGTSTHTIDALHVACALELGAERFWTFDQRQGALARALGLAA
ncbi:MAG: type II toxin-antitoxin system VapC family toxin [Candidatus Eremiobacteraeota bacterium]|nr:type II toxin-antitoxin system VapC family toxin [Candidatus Eremiobacteraeota bacterium]